MADTRGRSVSRTIARGLDSLAEFMVLAREQGSAQLAQVGRVAAEFAQHRTAHGHVRAEKGAVPERRNGGPVIEQSKRRAEPTLSCDVQPRRRRALPARLDRSADKCDLRVVHRVLQLRQPVRGDVHVVVGERDDVAAGDSQSGGDRVRLAGRRDVKMRDECGRKAARVACDDACGVVRRAVVGDEHLVATRKGLTCEVLPGTRRATRRGCTSR